MKFTSDLIEEAKEKLFDYLKSPGKYQDFEIEAPEGFNPIPVMEQVKAYNLVMKNPIKVGERLTRIMITKKPIKISLEGKEIGCFSMNNENDPFDIFPVFKTHPSALNALFDVCTGDFFLKYLPPLKNIKENEKEKT